MRNPLAVYARERGIDQEDFEKMAWSLLGEADRMAQGLEDIEMGMSPHATVRRAREALEDWKPWV